MKARTPVDVYFLDGERIPNVTIKWVGMFSLEVEAQGMARVMHPEVGMGVELTPEYYPATRASR